eukprot:5144282-Prymnesium_polylepis.1
MRGRTYPTARPLVTLVRGRQADPVQLQSTRCAHAVRTGTQHCKAVQRCSANTTRGLWWVTKMYGVGTNARGE